MNWIRLAATIALSFGMACESLLAQAPAQPKLAPPAPFPADPPSSSAAGPASGLVVLEWTPPALAQSSAQATVKSNFTFDKTMLAAMSGLIPDADAEMRQAVAKLDGVSVHVLRFGAEGITDETQVEALRQAYHLRGWKHLVTTPSAANSSSAVHNETTDLWLAVDGANVRGAVVLMETPRSLTLVTVTGNLSPLDLLHLRGHFGIPRFQGDGLRDANDK